MNLLADKYAVFRKRVAELLPAPYAGLAADLAVRNSTRRCRTALAGPSLATILSHARGPVYLRPVDVEAVDAVRWDVLPLAGAAGVLCPDEEVRHALDISAPGLACRVEPDEVLAGLAADGAAVLGWTGQDGEWFTPKIPGLTSLYDTVACRDEACREAVVALEKPAPGLRVVFAGSTPLYTFSRQVGAMEPSLLSPRLLTVHPSKGEYPLAGFVAEVHASASIVDFMHIVSLAEVDLWHFSCTMNLYYQAVLGKLLARCPVVFEFNDTSSFFYTDHAFAYLYGQDSLKLERFSEDFVCRSMDSTVFQTQAGADYQRAERGELNPSLVFPPRPLATRYLTPDPAAKGPGLRVVYAGVVAPTCKPREIFGDIHMRPVVDRLLDQGLSVDIYTNDLMGFGDLFEDYLYLAALRPEFGFHSRIHPDRIGEVLGKYHFGLMIYDFTTTGVGRKHFETILPTKMMAYIEAGIPVLVSAELTAVAEFVREYGLGLVVPRNGLDLVAEILAARPYAEVLRDFTAGRERVHMCLEIGRLAEFYAAVCAGRVR